MFADEEDCLLICFEKNLCLQFSEYFVIYMCSAWNLTVMCI